MNESDTALLGKLRKHLHELHTAWTIDPKSDGHCKSNEGYVGVELAYPNWFETDDYLSVKPEVISVEVYSYLFGPNRLHEYGSLEEAWDAVSKWRYRS